MRDVLAAARAVSIVAVLFGLVTVGAGTRALLGASPGYVVYLPLLIFNTAMGFAYVAVGILAWRGAAFATPGAAAILLLNLAALASTGYLHVAGGPVAIESLRAMGFRTAVWLALFLVLAWARRRGRAQR